MALTLFLSGDVMLGRGVDQILPHPNESAIDEPFVRDARDYVELAERQNGAIPRPVAPAYVWGDALADLDRQAPDLRLINLETSITGSDGRWPKGINYRLHPANAPCLREARIDGCLLANNHVLDYGHDGLRETLATLDALGIRHAGAGRDLDEAAAPALFPVPGKGRAVVAAFGTDDSGIPPEWAATPGRPGVHRLPDLSPTTAAHLAARYGSDRRDGDVLIASVHWGGNWGFAVPPAQRAFAHALIDGGFDLVHGHSSHHVKGIERYRGRLILYGCGDLIDDYEGIREYAAFRGDLGLLYLVTLADNGALTALSMVPTRIRRLRIERAHGPDADWLHTTLSREAAGFGLAIEHRTDGTFRLR